MLLSFLLAASGCGYALVGRGSSVPADVREVYLAPLENRTQRTQVEQVLTRAVADELVTRRSFTVTASAEGADAQIAGAVLGFDVNPVSFDQNGRATEYEIVITAQVRFARVGAEPDDVLWKNDRYLFRESYPVEVSEADYFDRENLAIEEVARDFAQTMVSDLLEGF
jgi:outer membrane lipopolysaccharide assembly protein LptE/RlpB